MAFSPDVPVPEQDEEIIPHPTFFGKRIVNTPFGQITVDWPEDPRLKQKIDWPQPPVVEPIPLSIHAWAVGQLPGSGNAAAAEAWGKGQLPTPPTQVDTGGGDNSGGGGRPPKQPTITTTPLPGESSELLSMPDLDKLVDEEIQRLTLSIIEEGKHLLLSRTADYKSIDRYPDVEIPLFTTRKKFNYIRNEFNQIEKAVEEKISKSRIMSDNYDYVKYLDFFNVEYNKVDGKPTLKFKVELENFNFNDLLILDVRMSRQIKLVQ